MSGNLRATLFDIAGNLPRIIAGPAGEDTSGDSANSGNPVALAARIVFEKSARRADGVTLSGHTDFEMQVIARGAADLSLIAEIGAGLPELPNLELRLVASFFRPLCKALQSHTTQSGTQKGHRGCQGPLFS